MEQIDKIVDQLDVYAEAIPELVKQCKKYKIRPGHVLGAAVVLVTLLMVVMKGYDILVAVLTCVYPMIMSCRAIENSSGDADKNWLCFWTCFGIFQTIEMFFGFILQMVPMYNWLRLAFFIFMMAP